MRKEEVEVGWGRTQSICVEHSGRPVLTFLCSSPTVPQRAELGFVLLLLLLFVCCWVLAFSNSKSEMHSEQLHGKRGYRGLREALQRVLVLRVCALTTHYLCFLFH